MTGWLTLGMMPDQWAEWLLNRRDGGDREVAERLFQTWQRPVRDRVLDKAELKAGERLLDVGCGDGLIAFGALTRIGDGEVVFSDISADLLAHCRTQAREMGQLERCQFLQASADDLGEISDATIDVVTTRSVLIYVERKRRALEEFWRVLRHGGRLSIMEPVNSFFLDEWFPYDTNAVGELAERVLRVVTRAAPASMVDFTERDLFRLVDRIGFAEVHMSLDVVRVPVQPLPWGAFLRSSPNPLAPTLEEAMAEALTVEEAERYVAHLRPQVEDGKGVRREALAYVWASKH